MPNPRILAALCLLPVLPAAARDEPDLNLLGFPRAPLDGPLVTDRPDFTESTETVPRGRFQLEGGYTFTYARRAGERTRDHSFGELLLRAGIAQDVELRIGAPSLAHLDADPGGRETGLTDSSLGFKIHALDQDGWIPSFGVIASVSLPTGSDPFSSDDVDPAVTLAWAYELTPSLGVAGNFNFAGPSDEDGRYFEPSASISLAASLTEQLGIYVEYFGFYPGGGQDREDTHFASTGLTWLVHDNLQFDVRVGAGLNEASDDLFAGAGFAVRW